MNTGRFLLGMFMLLSLPLFAATPAEHIVWDKTPVVLTLTVGEERMVDFPATVRVGVPVTLSGRLRSQSADGRVYWQASAPFKLTRVQVREVQSGRTYLFDIKAVEKGGPTTALKIHVPKPSGDDDEIIGKDDSASPQPDYITLTRYAAQQLYAPQRLLQDIDVRLPNTHRTPLGQRAPIPLYRGGQVEALPLVAWRGGGLFVTAVKLTNTTQEDVYLDPRDLRGQWLTITFHHPYVLAAGDERDTTCVYLISKRPFMESL